MDWLVYFGLSGNTATTTLRGEVASSVPYRVSRRQDPGHVLAFFPQRDGPRWSSILPFGGFGNAWQLATLTVLL